MQTNLESLSATVKDYSRSWIEQYVVPDVIKEREAVFKQRLLYQLMTSASEVLGKYNYENSKENGWDRIQAASLVANLSDHNINIKTTRIESGEGIRLDFSCSADVYNPDTEYSDKTKEIVDEILRLAYENFHKTARYDV